MTKRIRNKIRWFGLLLGAFWGVTACQGWEWNPDPGPMARPTVEEVTAEKGEGDLEVVITCRVSRMAGIKACGILFGEEEMQSIPADNLADNLFSVSIGDLQFGTTYSYKAYIDSGRSKVFSEIFLWKTVEDDGCIRIQLPPSNEVWYESHSGKTIPLAHSSSLLVSNTYADGKGIYRFSSDLTSTEKMFDYSEQCTTTKENEDFKSLILPENVSSIGTYGISHLCNATKLVLPYHLASLGSDCLCRLGESTPETTHIYFIGETAPSFTSTSLWNLDDHVSGGKKIDYFYYPEGNDSYNSLLTIRLHGSAQHYWVPAKYKITFSE